MQFETKHSYSGFFSFPCHRQYVILRLLTYFSPPPLLPEEVSIGTCIYWKYQSHLQPSIWEGMKGVMEKRANYYIRQTLESIVCTSVVQHRGKQCGLETACWRVCVCVRARPRARALHTGSWSCVLMSQTSSWEWCRWSDHWRGTENGPFFRPPSSTEGKRNEGELRIF